MSLLGNGGVKINLNNCNARPVELCNRTKEQRSNMKIKRLNVDWDKQFPMRAAVQLVRVARRFQSRIVLRFGAEVADARSVLSVVILASSLTSGLASAVDVEASGDDEQEAIQAVTEHLSHKTDHIF